MNKVSRLVLIVYAAVFFSPMFMHLTNISVL